MVQDTLTVAVYNDFKDYDCNELPDSPKSNAALWFKANISTWNELFIQAITQDKVNSLIFSHSFAYIDIFIKMVLNLLNGLELLQHCKLD
jgi:hypothetical protein